jgi:multiple sugar transport system permease protein
MSDAPRSFAEPAPLARKVAGAVVIAYAALSLLPLMWIGLTAFKSQSDAIAYPPKLIFTPTLEGFVDLFTVQTHQPKDFLDKLPPPATWYEKIARARGMVIAGPSQVVGRFVNSLIIGFGSTILATFLGTLAAYAFSRFKVPLKDDLMFFILATRMMPPIAVAVPIYMMYRYLNLYDTRIGIILLYTAVNVSLAVRKVVLPQAVTGIAATAIFCLIFSWNEYAFDLLLSSSNAQTMPPFIPFIIGEGGQDWPAVAAGTTLFLAPIAAFTVLLRKHLLRGITFGAVRR